MRPQLPILVMTLCLAFAAPALAQTRDGGFVVWDQSIASAVRSGLPDEHRCGSSPYAVYGPRCRHRLNLSFDRPLLFLTFLDRAALFVHKYHKLNYNQSLWDNAKLKFEVNLKNVYEQEVRTRIELRYRFPVSGPRRGLLAGADAIDLPPPSFYEN
ncbi:MAG: hypothetical protein ACREGK_12440 [Geminicoccales bacterium]